MVFSTAGFARVFPEKRLELKNLKGWAKAKELEAPCPELNSLRPSLKTLQFEPFFKKNSRKMVEPREHRWETDPLLK
jgi:hypothetical protein